MKQILTIAGSDSGGGAGIQADIKAIHANSGFGMSVITSITAQNTLEVTRAFDLPIDMIEAQIDAIFSDFDVAALKTGMLSSSAIVQTVAKKLRQNSPKNIVIDPVMISKSKFSLLKPEAIESLKSELLPLATVVTPNVYEAELLAGCDIRTIDDAKRAAKAIHEYGCQSVLVKGGHLLGDQSTDVLYADGDFTLFEAERIETKNTHGTGCTYSAAIATHLGLGKDLVAAIRSAKDYITNAIRYSLEIGHGHGPTNHFYFLTQ
ncbi:MAG: bifunctional hydroxymethylpyrimidine kinase/phosphomethylpyrimidine kinase [Candidatus Poribacteria bacterium]|nr:bifunctional hydroxymethylpyrimidine kinase/phosphomethylpyrimidine kinase [Candidatus Poribacteria bacterium]